ncbi:MAG: hypothetical protein ACRD3T_14365 [Terriglobia bacterium]
MLRVLFQAILLVGFLPLSLWAQGGAPSMPGGGPTPFGSGAESQLNYAGQSATPNLLLLGTDTSIGYSDNVRGSTIPVGDSYITVGPHFLFDEQRRDFTLQLAYSPYFQVFQHLSQYNTVSEVFAADGLFRFGTGFSLHLRDSLSYLTGTFQPPSEPTGIPGLGAPTSLNQTIVTPIVPEVTNNTRVDAIFHRSTRTSLTFFGSYNRLDFLGRSGTGSQYFNTRDVNAGIEYSYRVTNHQTAGLQYVYDNMDFGGSSILLTNSRAVIHSAFLSWTWQMTPSVNLTLFGGPQYILPAASPERPGRVGGLGLVTVNPVSAPQWQGAAGATLTKQVRKTAFSFSAMRAATDGGGLLTSVTSLSADAGVRRHLMRRWDVSADVMASRADELGSQFAGGRIDSQTASFGVSHGLSERLTASLSYSASRAQSHGAVPFTGNFNVNRVTLSFALNAKGVSLGR